MFQSCAVFTRNGGYSRWRLRPRGDCSKLLRGRADERLDTGLEPVRGAPAT